MNIKNPRITVCNTDEAEWLVTAEGLVSASDGLETITFTVLVPRSDKSLPEVTREAARGAIRMLQGYLDQPIG